MPSLLPYLRGTIDIGQPLNRSAALARGLVGLWLPLPQGPFTGGARLMNLCGNHHATLNSSPTWGACQGLSGRRASLILDGTGYASVADDDAFDFDGSVRDMSWLVGFRRKTHDTNDGILSKKAGTGSANPGYSWMMSDGGDVAIFTWHDTGASARQLTTTTTINDTTRFYNLAVTYSLSETRGRIFVDETQEQTDNISDIGDCTNSEPFLIGSDAGATSPGDLEIAYYAVYHRLMAAEDLRAFRLEFLAGWPTLVNRVRTYSVFDVGAGGGGGGTFQKITGSRFSLAAKGGLAA